MIYPLGNIQEAYSRILMGHLKGALHAKLEGGEYIMLTLFESLLVADYRNDDNKDQLIANYFIVKNIGKLCSRDKLPPQKTIT